MTPTQIARICHEVNRVYCESLGDYSQPSWETAPDWQRDSTIKGVEYALAHPVATPEDLHISWLAQKASDGWQYGDVKDPVAKTHPCFRPYAELPEAQRRKDQFFLAIVRASK